MINGSFFLGAAISLTATSVSFYLYHTEKIEYSYNRGLSTGKYSVIKWIRDNVENDKDGEEIENRYYSFKDSGLQIVIINGVKTVK